MPELPEVETVKRGLEQAMLGGCIERIITRRKDLRFAFPRGLTTKPAGASVTALDRRGKYIRVFLDNGLSLILHLGMSGRFSVKRPDGGKQENISAFYYPTAAETGAAGPHDHVEFHLKDGTRVIYTDPRRFGIIDMCATSALEDHKFFRHMGVEPLGNALNAELLHTGFKNSKRTIKTALLDQRLIAGLGNIYVCEALYRTRISPKKLSGSLARGKKPDIRLDELIRHIRALLQEAITAGGSTLNDYAQTDGSSGGFQFRFDVYDREGEACRTPQCKGHIKRIVQSARSSFYCPRCQR